MIELRLMTIGDIAAGNALCRSAGWNQTDKDWQIFLELNPQGCFVAVDTSNKVLGTVTTIRYDDRFAWIGMVLVDPSRKREGIGTALLNKAMSVLNDVPCIKLDATPAGREVYLKLGFRDEYTLSRMINTRETPSQTSDEYLSTAGLEDPENVMAVDEKVFGASRKELLNRIYSNLPSHSFVNASDAYCFARRGHNYLHIGPIVAPNVKDAIKLVERSVALDFKSPKIIDVPHHSVEWLQWLGSIGFTWQRDFTRMFKGDNLYPGHPHQQFAILGPEFG